MPPRLMGSLGYSGSFGGGSSELLNIDYHYDYPGGLNLRPGSELHGEILNRIMQRGQDAQRALEGRHSSWDEMERVLTAYVDISKDEKEVLAGDPRKPVSVVVPSTFATLDTLMTYMVSALGSDRLFQYEGVGPEDSYGAILLEHVINYQSLRAKMLLNCHTQWRDQFTYGFGAVAARWDVRTGYRTVREPLGFFSRINGLFRQHGVDLSREQIIQYEGNELFNIDPYMYLPDPNVLIHEVQSGEYVGWVSRTNRFAILEDENSSLGEMFNAKYLKHISGEQQGDAVSILYKGKESRAHTRNHQRPKGTYTSVVDLVEMYVNLIPAEWKLGNSEVPEKWLFTIAGDTLVLRAQPMGLNHNMFPVSVSAADFDGHSLAPLSRLEITYPLQKTIDFLFSSHTHNVRKALNDMLVVDPSQVNINDLASPEPGKLIRLRRAVWGRGVKDAVSQLQVNDVTREHIPHALILQQLIQQATGATDIVQGNQRRGSERVSATEARGVQGGALSRLERLARISSIMGIDDLAYILASQTQQLVTQERYVKLMGNWPRILIEEGYELPSDGRISVGPEDLDINFDITPHDGSVTDSTNIEMFIQLFQTALSAPEALPGVDLMGLYLHIARLGGAKNIQDFVKRQPQPDVSAAPIEQIDSQVQAGNYVPIDEAGL